MDRELCKVFHHKANYSVCTIGYILRTMLLHLGWFLSGFACTHSLFAMFPLVRFNCFTFLLQVAVFSPTFLHFTGLLLPRAVSLDGGPTLVPFLELLDFIGQELAGDLLILGPGTRGLGFDYKPGGSMDQLDGGVGFVLVGLAVLLVWNMVAVHAYNLLASRAGALEV